MAIWIYFFVCSLSVFGDGTDIREVLVRLSSHGYFLGQERKMWEFGELPE